MYEELKRLQQKYPIGTEINVVEQIHERKLPRNRLFDGRSNGICNIIYPSIQELFETKSDK